MDILEQLKRDEGCRLKAYRDSLGFWTIGYGHKLLESEAQDGALEWTQEQADKQLEQDFGRINNGLILSLPWVRGLGEPREGVLQNMAFNMGVHGILGFHRTLAMVEAGSYAEAAEAMLESEWAQQVGPRATRLSQQMKNGEWV